MSMFLQMLVGGLLGLLLADMGYTYDTWQFWAIIVSTFFVIPTIQRFE